MIININFRREILKKIFGEDVLKKTIKKAEIYGDVIKSLEQKGFEQKDDKSEQKKNEPIYSGKIAIPGVKAGVSVQVPDNPIVNGKYNVLFQIRPGKGATNSGVNTIVVNAEAGGMASAENTKAFGNSAWVKQQLATIHSALTKVFGNNISLGKLSFSSFSGGYSAVGNILRDPQMRDRIDSVIVLDGIHYGERGKPNVAGMQPWLDYARAAKEDPNKRFIFLYTAVDPSTYASTSDSAKYLLDQLNIENKKTSEGQRTLGGVVPAGIGQEGGFSAIRLYDRKTDKPGYGYSLNEMKKQHISAANALGDVLNEYLYNDWNK